MPSASQVVIPTGAAATVLVAAEAYTPSTGNRRRRLKVRNRGTANVFVGGAGVTTATGYQLSAGDSEEFVLDTGESMHAVHGDLAGQRIDVLVYDDERLGL